MNTLFAVLLWWSVCLGIWGLRDRLSLRVSDQVLVMLGVFGGWLALAIWYLASGGPNGEGATLLSVVLFAGFAALVGYGFKKLRPESECLPILIFWAVMLGAIFLFAQG